jgi:hypothetical protein
VIGRKHSRTARHELGTSNPVQEEALASRVKSISDFLLTKVKLPQ